MRVSSGFRLLPVRAIAASACAGLLGCLATGCMSYGQPVTDSRYGLVYVNYSRTFLGLVTKTGVFTCVPTAESLECVDSLHKVPRLPCPGEAAQSIETCEKAAPANDAGQPLPVAPVEQAPAASPKPVAPPAAPSVLPPPSLPVPSPTSSLTDEALCSRFGELSPWGWRKYQKEICDAAMKTGNRPALVKCLRAATTDGEIKSCY